MLIDLSLMVTRQMQGEAQMNEAKAFSGHLGTHFDVMNQEFPLVYSSREAIVFDLRSLDKDEIELADVDLTKVKADSFVAFCSGFIERVPYGSREYFREHPELSVELINALLERKISIIGVDFAGVRRGNAHTPMDQYCADRGVFIVENLCNLGELIERSETFVARTFPLKFEGWTGLPCRVIAEIKGEFNV